MDGIFNINKPAGCTSFSMVAMVKRLTGERRVGHAGTLDPMASGVLPVCCGKGTRVVEFLLEASKAYRAQIELGAATDTYDATGRVISQGDASSISRQQIQQALASFRGEIQQTPPMYSALKHRGQRLYHLARAGITVSRSSRPATIHRLELVEFEPPLVTVEIACSRGTYIRSLAHNMGELLGCGAHLKELVRLSYGPFDIKDAISPSRLESAFSNNDWRQLVYPVDFALAHWPSVTVDGEQERLIKNGSSVAMDNINNQTRCRAYNKDGSFLGVLRLNTESGRWQPEKVFIQVC